MYGIPIFLHFLDCHSTKYSGNSIFIPTERGVIIGFTNGIAINGSHTHIYIYYNIYIRMNIQMNTCMYVYIYIFI